MRVRVQSDSEVPLARRAHDALLASGQNRHWPKLSSQFFNSTASGFPKWKPRDNWTATGKGTAERPPRRMTPAVKRQRPATGLEPPQNMMTQRNYTLAPKPLTKAAAKAHMDACLYHGRAMAYHGKKVENAAVEISEPEDDEPAK